MHRDSIPYGNFLIKSYIYLEQKIKLKCQILQHADLSVNY